MSLKNIKQKKPLAWEYRRPLQIGDFLKPEDKKRLDKMLNVKLGKKRKYGIKEEPKW